MVYGYRGFMPKVGKRVFIAKSADVIGEVEIGDDSSIWFNSVVRADINYIKIGKRVNLQDLSMIHVEHYTKADKSDGSPTIIEDDVTIGHGVILHGCKIGKCSLIGMGTTILDNAVIGDNSLVGAKSLVTKNKVFPPNSLIIGSPARVIRTLTKESIKALKQSAIYYMNLKNNYLL